MEKEVALKATLFVNNNKTKATRSVAMRSTAGNPVPTVKAGGNADLEKKFCTFIFAMFGFFSMGCLLPAPRNFGSVQIRPSRSSCTSPCRIGTSMAGV